MIEFQVTVIGQELFDIMRDKFKSVDLNDPIQTNKGMLGNLKALTFTFEVDEADVIEMRNRLLWEISDDHMRMTAMFAAGDWMKLYVIKPIREIRDQNTSHNETK